MSMPARIRLCFPKRDPDGLALLPLGCLRGMGLCTPVPGVSALWLRHSEARAQVPILRDLVRVTRGVRAAQSRRRAWRGDETLTGPRGADRLR